jgi:hypothetical protein
LRYYVHSKFEVRQQNQLTQGQQQNCQCQLYQHQQPENDQEQMIVQEQPLMDWSPRGLGQQLSSPELQTQGQFPQSQGEPLLFQQQPVPSQMGDSSPSLPLVNM